MKNEFEGSDYRIPILMVLTIALTVTVWALAANGNHNVAAIRVGAVTSVGALLGAYFLSTGRPTSVLFVFFAVLIYDIDAITSVI